MSWSSCHRHRPFKSAARPRNLRADSHSLREHCRTLKIWDLATGTCLSTLSGARYNWVSAPKSPACLPSQLLQATGPALTPALLRSGRERENRGLRLTPEAWRSGPLRSILQGTLPTSRACARSTSTASSLPGRATSRRSSGASSPPTLGRTAPSSCGSRCSAQALLRLVEESLRREALGTPDWTPEGPNLRLRSPPAGAHQHGVLRFRPPGRETRGHRHACCRPLECESPGILFLTSASQRGLRER